MVNSTIRMIWWKQEKPGARLAGIKNRLATAKAISLRCALVILQKLYRKPVKNLRLLYITDVPALFDHFQK